MRTSRAVLAFAIGLAVVACKPKKDPPAGDDDTGLAEDATDVNATEGDAEALTSTLIGGAPGGPIGLASSPDLSGGHLSGAAIGDGAKAIYTPPGCLTVTSSQTAPGEGNATYTFAGCFGPPGVGNVTGVVRVTYKATPNHLTLDLVGDDLLVNRATVDWSAHAEIAANGAERTMTWKATLTGTTPRGREFSRSNDKVVSWTIGEPCLGLSGTSQGNIRGRNVRTEITAFRRCKGGCPDAGGRIVVTNLDTNARIEVRYDGTNRATLVGPNGRETTLPLVCR